MSLDLKSFSNFKTTYHHFGLYFPGKITTMSLCMAIHKMFDDDDSAMVYDAQGWLLPMGILFSRECDRTAFMELLAPYGFSSKNVEDVEVVDWNYSWSR